MFFCGSRVAYSTRAPFPTGSLRCPLDGLLDMDDGCRRTPRAVAARPATSSSAATHPCHGKRRPPALALQPPAPAQRALNLAGAAYKGGEPTGSPADTPGAGRGIRRSRVSPAAAHYLHPQRGHGGARGSAVPGFRRGHGHGLAPVGPPTCGRRCGPSVRLGRGQLMLGPLLPALLVPP